MNRGQILIVEDDDDIANVLNLTLNSEGYTTTRCGNATDALKKIDNNFDLIILDLGLPDIDGGELLQKIRQKSKIPVIVLTARDSVGERVRILEFGANDYVIKPFYAEELIARINVQIKQKNEKRLISNSSDIILEQGVLYYKGRQIKLSSKESEIFGFLLKNSGKIMSREEIQREVWGLNVSTNKVDVHINAIRTKLKSIGVVNLVRTVRGLGYSIKE